MLSQLPFIARYNPWLGDLCFEAGCSRDSPAGWITLGDSVPAVPGQAASFAEAALLPTLLSQPVHTAFDLRASKLAVQQGHHGRVEGMAASLRDRRGVVRSCRDEMWHVLPACCPWMQEKKTSHDGFPAQVAHSSHGPSPCNQDLCLPCTQGSKQKCFPSHTADPSSICQICFPSLGQLALGCDTLLGRERPE